MTETIIHFDGQGRHIDVDRFSDSPSILITLSASDDPPAAFDVTMYLTQDQARALADAITDHLDSGKRAERLVGNRTVDR